MEILDKVDRKILFALDVNSRASYEVLAKTTRLPAETVRYRIRGLVDRGVIFKFHGIVDTALLDYSLYKIWLKLQLVSEEEIQELMEYLYREKNVSWLVRLEGDYDICFVVVVSRLADLHAFLGALVRKFSPHIAERGMSVNIRASYLHRDYLVRDRRKEKKVRLFHAAQESKEFDAIDRKILKYISNDSRISASEIADRLVKESSVLAISRVAVAARIGKLEKQRVVTGYNLVLNHSEIGQLHYKLLVRLGYSESERLGLLYQHLKSVPQVVYLIETLGEWDFEVDIEVGSVAEYREVLRDAFSPYSSIVRDFQTLLIRKIWKYDVVPTL